MRFDEPLNDAETMILDKNEYILDLGQKPKTIQEIQGQYIGLMRFRDDGIESMKYHYHNAKKEHEITGKNPLNQDLEFKKSYMTDFLRWLIKNGNKIKAVTINNRWLEVDTLKDYETYTKMYNENTLNEFFCPDK
jgi:choline kinase